MRVARRLTAALAAGLVGFVLLAGCTSAPMRAIGADQLGLRQAERDLSAGIRAYQDGEYRSAEAKLQAALAGKLAFTVDQATAYKYLAFIHCSTGRTVQCRAEFQKAFAADQNFELTKAESGHPAWGPVYQSVLSEQRGARR
jgi:Tfp pilus assembly protein PilF